MSTDYNVELGIFEGPLDLLLHLVRKHELDIMDIPISFITEKYLAYLDLMRNLNLDIAGEYLLMAATLAHIKSRELLPSTDPTHDADEGEDDGIDPRQELIRRLLDYQKYREAAMSLGDRPVVGRNVWVRGSKRDDAVAEEVDRDLNAPLAEVAIDKLLVALENVLKRAKINLAHEVSVDRMSVRDRINQLVYDLEAEGELSFFACFSFLEDGHPRPPGQIKHDVVVTFLAILEMAKLGMVKLSQPEGEDDIVIRQAATDLAERVTDAADPDAEYH